MIPSITKKEFEQLKDYIEKNCGILVDEDKQYLIEGRLSNLVEQAGCSTFGEFYNKITTRHDQQLQDSVIDAITTNETMWFRDRSLWTLLEDVFLPKYIRELRTGSRDRVRIWSAACSTGQEPYSIAMTIDSYFRKHGITDIDRHRFQILATDISHSVLEKARRGVYDNISMARGMDLFYRNRYFVQKDNMWVISENIRNMVEFRQFNLQKSFSGLGTFDLVFLRYVMIYFSQAMKSGVLKKMAHVLNPDGVLLVGNSEVFIDYHGQYKRHVKDNVVYYQLKETTDETNHIPVL
ncbi:MAG TPA: protein-glutamate O-methyltransferase CheR [Clostridiales bacterium]|nr:protein-glutamate O-methyltransferase CheR [Clostridiales bacterium]